VYSFYATKTITTGEGGMLVTESDELARRVKIMRLHGIDRDVWDRYTRPGSGWKYDIVAPGYKYNLTDLASAIGRVQLRRAEELLQRRTVIARRYLSALRGLPFLSMPPEAESHAWHLFIVRLREEALTIDRDRFMEELSARGIGASVHFISLHQMSYYRDRYGLSPDDFPAARDASRCCMSLPLSASLSDRDAERVIEAVTEIGTRFRR
jgi:dTDP-4-amino-4,6-dideoxygalactose transaminase